MTNTAKMEKYTAGFGLSLVVTSILNALILLIKELNAAVMSALKAALGHHWTTHGAIVIILFVVLGFVFSCMKIEEKWDSQKMLKYIVWATIISGLIIAAFFLPNLKVAQAIKY
jgi:ABC-type multidrug transport system permease subunit